MHRTIDASTELLASAERATRVLRDRPFAVIGAEHLRVDLGAGVHHDVDVVVGECDERLGTVARPVRWRAHGLEHLLPAFDGELIVERGDDGGALLRLRGEYTAPLGPAGGVVDSVAGRLVARRTLHGIVAGLARQLDRAALPLEPPDADVDYAVTVVDRVEAEALG